MTAEGALRRAVDEVEVAALEVVEAIGGKDWW
jgi:hypothetical protein